VFGRREDFRRGAGAFGCAAGERRCGTLIIIMGTHNWFKTWIVQRTTAPDQLGVCPCCNSVRGGRRTSSRVPKVGIACSIRYSVPVIDNVRRTKTFRGDPSPSRKHVLGFGRTRGGRGDCVIRRRIVPTRA
jgi:hypothetical protein